MAALTASFQGFRPVFLPIDAIEIGADGADDYFRGAVVTYTGGKIDANNPGTSDSAGAVAKEVTTTAADELVLVYTRGIMWFTGVAALTLANQGALIYPAAGSDNPADLTATAAGNCGALGRLLAVEVTAVSGYIDISDRALANNAV